MITPRILATTGSVPWLARALRWYAGQYRENSLVEIRHGSAAGLRWRRHHRYVNGYWIGHYELAIQEALERELQPGNTFFDFGANAGFFTLVAARLVGSTGRCIAFEPSRGNCASIHEQIELNSLCPCSVVTEAISDMVGSTFFSFPFAGAASAHLGEPGNGEQQITVKVTTVDGACTRFGKPDFIKMDIEGEEGRALKCASDTLRRHRPVWLIELHGTECEREVKAHLQEARYAFFDLQGVALNQGKVLPRHFIARPCPTSDV